MTYAELRRMTLSGNYGDIDVAGNDIVMPILDSFGDEIGFVTFYSPDGVESLEDIDIDELEVKSFDF